MAIVLTQPQPPAPHLHPSPLISSKPLPTSSICPHDTSSSPRILSLTPTTPLPKSRPPPLPAELHLQIIDTIASRIPHTSRDEPYDPTDLEALCTCSLVCKLWMNIARVGIWAGVRLSSRRKSMAFVKLLQAYAKDGRSRVDMPSLGFYVVHLSIRETQGNAWDPKWLNDALPTLAAHLPRVHSLEMERVTWEYLSARSREACLKAFKHATTLTLREFAFHTSRDMCNFLAEFGDLKVLTLDAVHCAKMNTPRWFLECSVDGERAVKSPSRMLKEVGVRGASTGPILEWILAGFEYQKEVGKRGPGITSIRLGGVGVEEADIIGKFLGGVGDSQSWKVTRHCSTKFSVQTD
ncbi:hypothetical protein PAXRUDRAFT_823333 [Paxillus rubicundulus Ve08.2h10]|uniref:F-box domain-containing protein n=1 Tax=Paxillus rubicundulus Ve08.2h10 TaxID=930991 RepID=A0A0D0DKB5_9AGAM|nr:hypothetical protein PAXRUDRAFT_823333 [Paxillus rubicundulus Ve08.2h10]